MHIAYITLRLMGRFRAVLHYLLWNCTKNYKFVNGAKIGFIAHTHLRWPPKTTWGKFTVYQ